MPTFEEATQEGVATLHLWHSSLADYMKVSKIHPLHKKQTNNFYKIYHKEVTLFQGYHILKLQQDYKAQRHHKI